MFQHPSQDVVSHPISPKNWKTFKLPHMCMHYSMFPWCSTAFIRLSFSLSKDWKTVVAFQASLAMVRLSLLALSLLAVAPALLPGYPGFVAPSAHHAVPRVALQAKQDLQESECPNIPAFVLALVAGLMVGLAPPSFAGTGSGRPDFQVVRPGYMQGIDASNAATKPGEIDYVTRSRIEAEQFPEVLKEIRKTQVKLQDAPTKEQRIENYRKGVEEYKKSAEIPP